MEQITRLRNYYLHELPDPRTKDWPILGSPVYLILITAAWMYFVFRAGPRHMKDRKPYELKGIIQVMNVFQVFINSYITYEFFAAGWLQNYTLPCTPMDYSTSPNTMRVIRAQYIIFLVKIFDYSDTIIYILRRKNNQVSFLHVYHHIGLPFIGWTILKYGPGGQGIFSPTVNAIVHVIMYTYYMIAALGPQYQRYLWWKKYLTRVQLIQFIAQFIHAMYTYLSPSCDYPRWLTYAFLPYIVVLFVLFTDFYIKSYTLKQQKLAAGKKKNDDIIEYDTKENILNGSKLPSVLNPCQQFSPTESNNPY